MLIHFIRKNLLKNFNTFMMFYNGSIEYLETLNEIGFIVFVVYKQKQTTIKKN